VLSCSSRAIRQACRKIPQRLFGVLARGNVSIYFENADRAALRIALQDLATRNHQPLAIARRVDQLAFP
jgi:hypothetical protein